MKSRKKQTKPAAAACDIAMATYDERVAPDKRAAVQESIASAIGHLKASREALLQSVSEGKRSINEMRLAGVDWIRAQDKNQFDMPFYDHADTLIAPADREFVTPEIVKTAIHLARQLPNPVKTEADASAHVQKVLFAFEILEKPARQLAGGSRVVNWGALIPVEIGKVNRFLQELIEVEPEDTWSLDRWATIAAQTQWVAELNARAQQKMKR